MQADGTVLIDTSIKTDGFESGAKDLELAIRRMAKSIEGLGDKAKISLQKQVDSFAKLNNQYSQQAKKVNDLENKLEELKGKQIETDTFKSLTKEIDSAQNKLDTFYGNIRKMEKSGVSPSSSGYKKAIAQIDIYEQKVKSLYAERNALVSSGNAYTPVDTTALEEKLILERTKLENINNRLNTSYMSLKQKMSEYGGNLSLLSNKTVKSSAEIGMLQSSLNGLQVVLNGLKALPSIVATNLKALPSKAVIAGINGLKSGFSKLISVIKKVAKEAQKAALAFAQMVGKGIVGKLKKISAGIFGLNKNTNKARGSFGKMLTTSLLMGTAFMALSSILRGMKDGINNLAKYSDETNATLSTLKSSLTQLKNALATAFAPIFSAVAPALNSLIKLLTSAATAVSRLIAALTGKNTFVKAKEVQQDYAESLEETGSAAEEAEGALASFDKLNVAQDNSNKGGGGGGGDLSPNDMFETVEVEPLNFDSWGEAFSSFLDYLLNNGIPALRNALTGLANWINTFAANLYEMFTFPGVREKVQLLGTELANALNDFTNQIDWAMIGKALGAGFDLAVQFLVSFIWTYDWMNLGASLAEMVNNALEQVDWYSFGKLLWAKFKIMIETAAGFLLNLNMKELAKAASNIAIGFFDSIAETIQNINWAELGQQLIRLLVGIDWIGIAGSVFDALMSAFGAVFAFLAGAIWELISVAWDSVVKWWEETAFEDGKFTITGLLNGILDALKNIGNWIKEHIFKPFIDGFKSVFGINSPSKVMSEMGEFLMEGLLGGITGLIPSIVDKFGELKDKVVEKLQGIADKIKEVLFGYDDLEKAGKTKSIKGSFASNVISVIPRSSEVYLPRLASGTVVPPRAGEFAAILGDNKRETEVVSPISTMKQALKEALGDFGGIGGGDIHLTVNLEGKAIYDTVVKRNRMEKNRTGSNPLLA